ncbi:ECF transporter S component [[Acholeplasma] multilocale]|uniref:ECF transporter S component n=1 Tax=[Acholeplasma] multilocale TaxID=264638 RepID=UPI0005548C55|nr:ECF transporter S component [[Acholeplasma] multilocale]
MRNISDFLLTGNNLAYVSAGITLVSVLLYIIYTTVDYSYKKKRNIPFKGIKFTTKNITYIAMMVAVSVSITVVISMTLPITVFPPVRVAFEGIMIKITGMIFGPVVGILVGLVTETLAMMFVPSYIHIAYFLVALGFGFWSGLGSFAFDWKGKFRWLTLSIISAFFVIATVSIFFILKTAVQNDDFTPKFFGVEISKAFYPVLFVLMMTITLVVIYILCGVLVITRKSKWLDIVLPIILICAVTEILCSVLLASWGDQGFLGVEADDGGYMSMVTLRIVQVPVKILFNTAVLTTVYSVLRPLIRNTK